MFDSSVGVAVVVMAIVIAAGVFAGSFRVERDPLAARLPRRLARELLGVGLLLGVIGITIYLNSVFPGPQPVMKSTATAVGGLLFVGLGGLLISSYFLPEHNAVFRTLSAVWESAPGPSGGREGLLFLGGVFGLAGVCVIIVGSGLFG